MDLHLKGKVVVVTGGGQGIGRAIVEEFLREGARVAICGRREEPMKTAQKEVRSEGYDLYYEICDVANREDTEEFAFHVEDKFGTVDVWVNNAGMNITKMLMEYTEEEYDLIMNTDLKSVFHCTQIAGGIMKRHGGGVIINASSFNSQLAHANGIIYAAAKAGVTSLTKSTAAALAPYGIRVVSYLPGLISTPLAEALIKHNPQKYIKDIALGRPGRTEEIAKPVVFLASDCASYISGVDIEITGAKFSVQDCTLPWTDKAEKE